MRELTAIEILRLKEDPPGHFYLSGPAVIKVFDAFIQDTETLLTAMKGIRSELGERGPREAGLPSA